MYGIIYGFYRRYRKIYKKKIISDFIIMTYDQLKQGLLEENNDCVTRLVNLFSNCFCRAWLWLLSVCAVHRFA